MNEAYGLFVDEILGELNATFSVMHRKIFHQNWTNGLMAHLRRNQVTTRWKEGEYECYIPTRLEAERDCLQFFRIIVKTMPEVDHETVRREVIDLQRARLRPVGSVDSELIVMVSPRRSQKARSERQFLRGFRHVKHKGFLTAIIVNPSPLICMKRLYTLIAKFLKARIKGLLEKLEFQPWQYDYKEHEYLYYSKLVSIIESFSILIATSLKVLSHSLNWILLRLKQTFHEVGLANMAQQALKTLQPLSRKDQISVLERIRAVLMLSQAPKQSFSHATLGVAETTANSDGPRFLEALATATRLDSLPDRSKVKWGA